MDDEGHADATASPPRGGVRRKALGDKRCIETLLPLQGAFATDYLPRAMPWAMRLLGLQPAP